MRRLRGGPRKGHCAEASERYASATRCGCDTTMDFQPDVSSTSEAWLRGERGQGALGKLGMGMEGLGELGMGSGKWEWGDWEWGMGRAGELGMGNGVRGSGNGDWGDWEWG